MVTSFTHELTTDILSRLRDANAAFLEVYPGESDARQPVHTVYGGAQIFSADTARKLGATALNTLKEYAPTPSHFAKTLRLTGKASHHKLIYQRVVEKLKREPVEDFRIDFEDGYGNRPDEEEDADAARTAEEVARGLASNTLSPFIGIRLKPFTEELKARSIRTLDIFVSTMVERTNGKLPKNFVVTLPKVTVPAQVSALTELFEILEAKTPILPGALKLEIMVETPQLIINRHGESALPLLVTAARGRCIGAHFGVYDYTASCGITASYQTMDHAACDFARHMMKVALAGTSIMISDGATNVMPVGPHRPSKNIPLTAKQKVENREVVHRAWRLGLQHINHSLVNGYYQGWDLHPAQLPVRYAAVYDFFLKGLDAAALRLKTFVEKAAQATLIGDVFDDAATGQGLLNFFLQGLSCGAISEEEVLMTGLTIEEVRTRSFLKILLGRKKSKR